MGFFNLYKPKEYKYRYIYYDPKKEAQKEREKERQQAQNKTEHGEYKPTIRRGTFREMADKNHNFRTSQTQKSNFRLIIILFLLFALVYFLLIV